MFQKRKSFLILLFFPPLLLIGTPMALYFLKFHTFKLSSNPSDWANLGSYFAAFVGLANVYVFTYLTISLYNYNDRRQIEELTRQNILDRPIIVFTMYHDDGYYDMKNIGKGSALNLIIKYGIEGNSWKDSRIAYSLKDGDELSLKFTWRTNAILCEYDDIFSNKFISIIEDDKMSVFQYEKLKELTDNKFYDYLNFQSPNPKWFHEI